MSLLAHLKIEDIPDGMCCCCGHSLGDHIDEGDGWRCHALGPDFYQCECFLRKGRYSMITGKDDISDYDLKKRIKKHEKEGF